MTEKFRRESRGLEQTERRGGDCAAGLTNPPNRRVQLENSTTMKYGAGLGVVCVVMCVDGDICGLLQ